MHLTVNSLTRECVNNGTSKVHRNFLRNNGERNKEKNSTISIRFMCIAKMKRKDIIAWGF